ncbi:MAG: AAA family ATPase, partial [Candidatus Brocadiae bacterium]|nr:AAA family ATPase [Candidatus Brocadiia bacterium]
MSDAARFVSDVLDPVKRAFVGKDEIVDLMGVCLVAGENLFILGPPGTAKSALVHELGRRLDGRTFEYLLTRFTEPNELFGPFDIRRLREGDLVTNTEGMLPEADFVFLDELLNANSAILNSLLTALNERVFRRGKETRPLPLLMVVGASNRLPDDDALGALFDRFLMRVKCDNVPGERLGEVLDAGWRLDLGGRGGPGGMKVAGVAALHGALGSIDLSPVRAAHVELVTRLRRAGIPISDRRAVKLQRMVAASAVLCGRAAAAVSDLWVFRHIWDTEEQQEVLAAQVRDAIGKAGEEAGAHPRARGGSAPDPEALARDLEGIETRLGGSDLVESERAALRDRLAALASRVPWVSEAAPRGFLQERVDAL